MMYVSNDEMHRNHTCNYLHELSQYCRLLRYKLLSINNHQFNISISFNIFLSMIND